MGPVGQGVAHDLARAGIVTRATRLVLGLALLIGLLVSTRDLTREGAVSMEVDMPKHLMNGVFMLDYATRGPFHSLTAAEQYAERYFARYPALTLGHHPPLLPALLMPAYAAFGVSVASARVVISICFLVSAWLMFVLARRLFGPLVGAFAALLLVSSPYLGMFSQLVTTEVPTVMTVLITWVALVRFRDSGRVRDYVLFGVAALISLTGKQTTGLLFPAYFVALLDRRGRALLRQPAILRLTVAGAAVVAAGVIATVIMSPYNVAIVFKTLGDLRGLTQLPLSLVEIVRAQVTVPLSIAALAGLTVAAYDRDRRMLLVVIWIVCATIGAPLIIGPFEPARYSLLSLPAFCLCAATMAMPRAHRGLAVGGQLAVATVFIFQLWNVAPVRPPGATGYEAAAQAVLAGTPAPTVLYSSVIDTGYFTFFLRKHDPAGRIAVIRANKLLTTSLMGDMDAHDNVGNVREVYSLMQRLGTRYVVLEDMEANAPVLDALRTELRTGRFTEVRRFKVESHEPFLSRIELIVYEYLDATAPADDAVIDIDVPLVHRRIRVPLRDAVSRER